MSDYIHEQIHSLSKKIANSSVIVHVLHWLRQFKKNATAGSLAPVKYQQVHIKD